MTLTRGARITGAVLCAVLALIAVAWIGRDIRAADGQMDLWEYLGGSNPRSGEPATTGQGSRVLLVAYVLAAVAALRSSAASSVLVVMGVVTFALRLPGLWAIDDAYPLELQDRARLSLVVAGIAAIALVVAGIAGRRPAPGGEPSGRPGRGAGVAAFLLLGTLAVVSTAWEIRQSFVAPPGLYPAWFTGGAPVHFPMTEAPPGWITVVVILLSLVAAFGAVARAAFARAAFARVLGLVAGGFSLLAGVMSTSLAARHDLYEDFADLRLESQLSLLTSVFLIIAGAAVIALLARPGTERAPGSTAGPWGGPNSWGGGWGAPAPGQPGPQGHQQPQAPGFGPPPGGGFGPPPSSPPPRW
ncbi:hypothetical protein [Streptomyces parvus]|uniref:hypothetical protein n=1 Tax=Streptomyces parvus TaxID=66428 RepID=UPI0036302434